MPLAGRNHRTSQRVDLQPPPGQAIEIHRGAGVGRIGEERRQQLLGLVGGKVCAVGAPDRCCLFEDRKSRVP